MTITHIATAVAANSNHTANGGTSGSAAIAYPASAATGYYCIVEFAWSIQGTPASAMTIGVPTGWTTLNSGFKSATPGIQYAQYGKFLTSADASGLGTWTWTSASGADVVAQTRLFTGVNGTTPVVAGESGYIANGATGTTTRTTPSITTAGSRLLIYSTHDRSGDVLTAPNSEPSLNNFQSSSASLTTARITNTDTSPAGTYSRVFTGGTSTSAWGASIVALQASAVYTANANAALDLKTTASVTRLYRANANAGLNIHTSAAITGETLHAQANAGLNIHTSASAAILLPPVEANAGLTITTSAKAIGHFDPPTLIPFTITVYDKDFNRQQSIGDPVHATFTPRLFPAVGSGAVELRTTDPANEWLQADGARVVVKYRGEFLFSGPVVSSQGEVVPGGTIAYQFEGDERIIAQTLGWVDPAGHLTPVSLSDPAQAVPTAVPSSQGYYDWGSSALHAETAIKRVLTANFDRLARPVTILPDLGRGSLINASDLPTVRFDPLDTIVDKIGSPDRLVLKVWQPDGVAGLHLDVTPSVQWAHPISYEAGQVMAGTFSTQAPAATRVVIGGPGEDVNREFYGVNDGSGLEDDYGQIIEVFTESTSGASVQWPDGTADTAKVEKYYPLTSGVTTAEATAFINTLIAAGANSLSNSRPTSGIDLTLSETDGFHFGGSDGFHIGDLVTVNTAGQSFTEQITECALEWAVDAFHVTPTLGAQTNDPNVVLLNAIQLLATRLRQQGTGR